MPDEDFWRAVSQHFALDHRYLMFNTGASNPAPRSVHEAHLRYLAYVNASPYLNTYNSDIYGGIGSVRRRIAHHIGADPEELAFTRNTTEGLAIAVASLELSPGDEIVTTDSEHQSVDNALRLRERRDGVVVRHVKMPWPARSQEQLVDLFKAEFTDRTRAVVVCEVQGVRGQIMPVRAICDLARERGAASIVDGALGFGQLASSDVRAMGCDYYATSLHKYLSAPLGTGFLYVRRALVATTRPLMGVRDGEDEDIRKLEAVGTHSFAELAAVAQALEFWETIGPARKAERLHQLKTRWTKQVAGHPRIHLAALPSPEHSCGTLGVAIKGMDGRALSEALRLHHRIWAFGPIGFGDVSGVYCAPNVFTLADDVDAFATALIDLAENNVPEAA